MPAHHSGIRLESYRTFQTSSGGAGVVAWSANSGTGSDHRRPEALELGLDAAQLADRLDEARDGRPAEVDEVGQVGGPVLGRLALAAPARGALLEPPLGQRAVATGERHERLY